MGKIYREKTAVTLGEPITLEDFVAAARHGLPVRLSQDSEERVERAEQVLRQWIGQGRAIYGATTGLGALCDCPVSPEDALQMQKNILRSHAVSVGEPLREEQARGVMVLVIQNLSAGHSGVRNCLLSKYMELLNKGVTPWSPGSGSVGYLSPEAHIALALTGEGKAYYRGELTSASEALEKAGVQPLQLQLREALAVISGTTSATALGALALHDMLQAAKTADVIAAMNVEVCGGRTEAFHEKVMAVRPHEKQADTAANLRKILKGSDCSGRKGDRPMQDPLSIRCIPQLHGAAKTLLGDARRTLEIEMNACCDNPVIFAEDGGEIFSACNADASFTGMAMDSAAIAAAGLAKMSERRTYRLLDGSVPGLPEFLIREPGINSGLMIVQYAQAGLLNEMRILASPASVDSVPTCAGQEDYVSMGYNAAKKAAEIAEKLEYILAIELLAVSQAGNMGREKDSFSPCVRGLLEETAKIVPVIEKDVYLHGYMEELRQMIHSGGLLAAAEELAGVLD